MTATFGELLNDLRRRLNQKRGLPYDQTVSWREIALRAGVNEVSLLRWEKDAGRPRSLNEVVALVEYFKAQGVLQDKDAGIFQAAGFPIDDDTAWFWFHRDHPEIKRLIAQIRERQRTGQLALQ